MTAVVWRCPKCGETVTVYVPIVSPPTCSKHTGGGTLMVKSDHDTG